MKRRMWRRPAYFLALVVATSGFGQDPNRPLHAVGEFSNMRFTDEHAYGYAVDLWRDGDSILGLFLAREGLAGDTPTGMLENVKFNPRTGALAFTAKLTTGVTLLPGGGQEPSRDLFDFSGTLKVGEIRLGAVSFVDGVVAGTLQRSDPRQPSRSISPERVELKIQRRAVWLAATSYAEWKRQIDEILKRRGPKW